ncbi:hypothetical protein GCM10010353_73390 [Streptomyces chryseus]|nr:hypothetical protein GCM10010353_73390 [Streptomyces chryseus]
MLTGGNTNDCTQFTTVMDAIRVPRPGPGRPRVRPAHVIGDKGYSSKAIRTWLRRGNIPHTIPERADQVRNRVRRGSLGGRPPVYDKQVYKHRNVVERCFNRLKQWRGIATRYACLLGVRVVAGRAQRAQLQCAGGCLHHPRGFQRLRDGGVIHVPNAVPPPVVGRRCWFQGPPPEWWTR